MRLHLLLKPHYDSQFRVFALENRRLFLDVANAYKVFIMLNVIILLADTTQLLCLIISNLKSCPNW